MKKAGLKISGHFLRRAKVPGDVVSCTEFLGHLRNPIGRLHGKHFS